MKRKLTRSKQRRTTKKNRSPRKSSRRKGARRRGAALVRQMRSRLLFPKTRYQTVVHQKALAVLALMRRQGLSLAKASKAERIKQTTVLRHVGRALHRSGPGKPWKATKADQFSAKMTILTENGPTTGLVHGSRERTRLARYDVALRKWRAGEHGAERDLRAFEGQTVAGHFLITDPDLLIQLEAAGQLDFDSLYFSVGGGS